MFDRSSLIEKRPKEQRDQYMFDRSKFDQKETKGTKETHNLTYIRVAES